jgi:hypothetical protein
MDEIRKDDAPKRADDTKPGDDESVLEKMKKKLDEAVDAPEAAEVDYQTNPVTGQPR